MTQKKFNTSSINVTIPYTLHNWSDSLTFDEIEDTLFLVGIYHDDKYKNSLSKKDRDRITNWLKNNDVNMFIKAKELAAMAYSIEIEKEIYAAEIMNTPYKRPRSN